MNVFFIAEAGVNHDGNMEKAISLVDVAADAGADAVKFQTFRADRLVVARAPKAQYQKRTTDAEESQFDMLRRLEFQEQDHFRVQDHCKARGIEFMSTPFDTESLRFLVERIGVKRLKIPSGEITNAPLLTAAARSSCDIILSTGASGIEDVKAALANLAFAMSHDGNPTACADLDGILENDTAMAAVRRRVTLLHCTSEYPAPIDASNLKAMTHLHEISGCAVGLSDHSIGLSLPLAAAAMGARVIEKHFSLDPTAAGPDHAASASPEMLKQIITGVREIEAALGNGIKEPSSTELHNQPIIRKSLVAAVPIKSGESFSLDNLTAKRPAGAMSPMRIWDLIGRTASKDYAVDDVIEERI